MAVAIAIAIVGLVITSATAKAAVIASDQASNYTDQSNFTANNFGSGFGSWVVNGTGSSVVTGGLFAIDGITNNQSFLVTRNFLQPLQAGDTFSLGVINTNPSTSGQESVIDFAVSGFPHLTIFTDPDFASGNWSYNLNQGSGGVNTGVPLSANSSLSVSVVDSSTVTFTITNGGGTSFTSPNVNVGNALFNSVVFESRATSTSVSGPPLEFNNLQITSVPEPSTYAMLIAGGLAMGGAAMRRRRARR